MSDKQKKSVPILNKEQEAERPVKTAPAQVGVCLPEDFDIELIEAFVAESKDLIDSAETALLSLETDPGDMTAVDTVFRAFHNIRGTSAFFEISLITEMAHYAESLIGIIRGRRIRYTKEYSDLALRAADMLKLLFQSVQDVTNGKPSFKPEGYDELALLLTQTTAAAKSSEAVETGKLPRTSEKTIFPPEKSGDVRAGSPRAGSAPSSVKKKEISVKKKEPEEIIHQHKMPIDEEVKKTEAASLLDVARGLQTKQYLETSKKQEGFESSARVPVERLDQFIDMVGELVVSHSMVAQDDLIAGSGHHDLLKKMSHTNKIIRELQNMSMSMRMVPLRETFRKMARLVRDMGHKLEKRVSFVTEGEDTEIDRNMVDIINDPIIHIIRNAMDHGIEQPDSRERAGKPPYGIVKLSAYHSSGNVVVKVKDDGRGFNHKAILAKARERGLLSNKTQAEDIMISEHEVLSLIFRPGFSTVKALSEVSGRGTGMNVVKKSIDALRGHIEIQSAPGKGSVVKITLPLTLAIIDGMVIRVGSEKYIMPTVSIVRSVRPVPEDISTVLRRGETVSVQGKLVPLFRLAELFDIEGAEQDPVRGIVMVIEEDGHQAGILVDELIGSQQIVIKTLGETMRNIPGISGSAIMPNGRVGLILDVGGLMGLANNEK